MGFFDSSSSSSSTSNTYNTDKRVVADGAGIGVSGDKATINVTDGGIAGQAIQDNAIISTSALENQAIVSTAALDSMLRTQESRDALASETISGALNLTDAIQKNVSDLGSNSFNKVIGLFDNLLGKEFDLLKTNQGAVSDAYATAQGLQNDAKTLDNRYLIAAAAAIIGIVAISVLGKK